MSLVLTRNQVRQVDRIAIDEYGIDGLVLMENAGRGAAEHVDRLFGPAASALVFCGTGNNGGDGFVIARHLHNRNWTVRIAVLGDESRFTPDTRANFAIANKMNLPIDFLQEARDLPPIDEATVVIDALLGTGFRGAVREPVASAISAVNESSRRACVAIDVPSGLDCDTGDAGGVAIDADHTITFVATKVGFAAPGAIKSVGQVTVVDIGCPRELIARVASSG